MGADIMWVFLMDTARRLAKKYDKPRARLLQLVKRHTEFLKEIVAAKAEVQP
jgi:hypothetical protein